MRKDRFTDEALAAAKALADLKYSESAEDQQAFAEAYDFARCQRPNGSFYGIAEGKQCKKGTKASPAQSKSKAGGMAKAKRATDERIGRLEERQMNPKANPAKIQTKLNKLEAKSARMGRVLSGKEAPTAKLEKAKKKLLERIGDLEDKLFSPRSKNPGQLQDQIDRMERKVKLIDSQLKRSRGKS